MRLLLFVAADCANLNADNNPNVMGVFNEIPDREDPMKRRLVDKAARIAAQPYLVLILRDETTARRPIYVADVVELEGCMAQGETTPEAVHSLREAAVDRIASMLEDGVPVPPPPLRVPVHAGLKTLAARRLATLASTGASSRTGVRPPEGRPTPVRAGRGGIASV